MQTRVLFFRGFAGTIRAGVSHSSYPLASFFELQVFFLKLFFYSTLKNKSEVGKYEESTGEKAGRRPRNGRAKSPPALGLDSVVCSGLNSWGGGRGVSVQITWTRRNSGAPGNAGRDLGTPVSIPAHISETLVLLTDTEKRRQNFLV